MPNDIQELDEYETQDETETEAPKKPQRIQTHISGIHFSQEERNQLKALRMPGDYLVYDIELVSGKYGILENRLDPLCLTFPNMSAVAAKRRSLTDLASNELDLSAQQPAKRGRKKNSSKEIESVKLEVSDGGRKWTPEQAVKVAYKTAYISEKDKKTLIWPIENIRGMLIDSARRFKQDTGILRAMGSAITIESMDGGFDIPILNPQTQKPYKYGEGNIKIIERAFQTTPENIVCILVVPATGAGKGAQKKILTARVYIPHWEMRFRMFCDMSIYSKDDVDKFVFGLFKHAAIQTGMGSWRPSAPKSPGPYGSFFIKKYEYVCMTESKMTA